MVMPQAIGSHKGRNLKFEISTLTLKLWMDTIAKATGTRALKINQR
jgi:hypothetical protein